MIIQGAILPVYNHIAFYFIAFHKIACYISFDGNRFHITANSYSRAAAYIARKIPAASDSTAAIAATRQMPAHGNFSSGVAATR